MNDFAARMVSRTTGETGIQPRIAPITAPDPWHEPVDLELVTLETEASPRPPAHPYPSYDAPPRRSLSMHARELERAGVESFEEVSVPEREAGRDELSSPIPTRTRDLRADASEIAMREVSDGPARVTGRVNELGAWSRELPEERDDAVEAATSGSSRARVVPSFRVHRPALARAHGPGREHSEPLSGIELHREIEATSPGSDANAASSSEPVHSSSSPRARAHAAAAALDPTLDAPRSPRRREGGSEGIVRVEIGRVELRAAPSREPARTERGVPKPETFVSLKQYLRERGGT